MWLSSIPYTLLKPSGVDKQTKEAMKHFSNRSTDKVAKSIYSQQPINLFPYHTYFFHFLFFLSLFPFVYPVSFTFPFYFYFLHFLNIFILFVSDPHKASFSAKLCILLSFSPWSISLLERIVSNINGIYFIIILR